MARFARDPSQGPASMMRIALAFSVLVAVCSTDAAQAEFDTTPHDRKAVVACHERVIGQPELKRMAECIGIVADPCPTLPAPTPAPSSPAICASRRSGTAI